MSTAHATYHDGQLVLDEPVDWPSGTRTVVVPESEYSNSASKRADSAEPEFILRDEDWPKTPEEIAEWLEWFDSREPVFTDEEYEQFNAELKRSKAEQVELVRRAWAREAGAES